MIEENKRAGQMVKDALRLEASKLLETGKGDGESHPLEGDNAAFADEEPHARGTWKNPWDFLFSCISVSVGLGNVWRFPYLCYKNGGGAFLIIYFISMIFCGIPVFLLEVALGQYLGAGGMTTIAQLVPILKGVGIATMVMVTYYNAYYCIIVGWSLYYFLASFVSIPDLPWDTCDGWWNTKQCRLLKLDVNGTFIKPKVKGGIAAVEEFWNNRVLQANDGLEFGLGSLQWELAGSLFLGWLIVYSIIRKGLHQSGYIIWFTALFPYVVMLTLLAKALSLEGAIEGLKAYVHVDWSYMQNGSTWIDAATQIFFAYSVGTGALSALGSYNRFHHNCFRDALITCVINTCTCLTAGVLVFSILGYMATLQETTVAKVARSGPGLVFITYPELVLSLPVSFFWAIIFFAMLLVLGIDTEFCSVESLITGIVDNWSEHLLPYRKQVAVGVCVFLYLLGLPMMTEGGIYVFQLMDFYSASGMSLLWICFFETIAVSWIYGVDKFSSNIEDMVGSKPFFFWYLCWKYFAPLVMSGVFVYYIVSYKPITYGSYEFPQWAEVLGLVISFSSMIWVPAYAIYYLLSRPGTLRENWIQGTTP
eukprot:maker-scaffold269_size230758-snap-gene-0.24 protein:Tk07990 transcript:maker-scaffold269_size230758-snap-gene-0.24-mRNA-1 annotation:"sodium- and chloride-dependent gaba transporter 1-like"